MQTKNFILTGTTGAGKTTVIEFLRERGHSVVREGFMDVYHQLRDQGHADPLAEACFLDEVVRLQATREQEARGRVSSCVYFDRSPLCTLALSQFMARAPSKILLRELARMSDDTPYETHVFFVQNLGFAPGNEVAKMRYEDLVAFEDVHREVYTAHGYKCIDIPALPVEDRARLILQHSQGEL